MAVNLLMAAVATQALTVRRRREQIPWRRHKVDTGLVPLLRVDSKRGLKATARPHLKVRRVTLPEHPQAVAMAVRLPAACQA